MHQPSASRRRPRAAVRSALVGVALLALAGAGLSACGGSSSSTTAATNAAAASTSPAFSATGPSGAGATGQGFRGARSGRFKALRECLQKNGITLPNRTPGQPPQGGFLGGGQLPPGVTRQQLQAAMKKCGGAAFAGGAGFAGAGRAIHSKTVQQALTKFASCMRENGVNVPAPNTSGTGPVFNTKGLDTTSPQFRQAESKCRAILQEAFRAGPAGGPPGGAPPTG